MPHLFSPFTLRSISLRNRIVMAPMCMYVASEDGIITDWQLAHYVCRATGGVGLIITEATAVEARGRNSRRDLGLWDDAQVEPLARVVRLCQARGAAMCCQLAHSGRKAWGLHKGAGPTSPVAPSPIPYGEDWVVPHELTAKEVDDLIEAYRSAARRALAAGFDMIEFHAAHGFLLHEFLSPVTNQRTDEYGGPLENRARLLLRIVEAVRSVWPQERLLLVKLSSMDWEDGGLTVADQVQVVRWLKDRGIDAVDCSVGHITSYRPVEYPGCQVPFAETFRREVGIPTLAVGMITRPEMAEEIVCNGRADMVVLGRELLRNPNWPLHAALALRRDPPWPEEYILARPV